MSDLGDWWEEKRQEGVFMTISFDIKDIEAMWHRIIRKLRGEKDERKTTKKR